VDRLRTSSESNKKHDHLKANQKYERVNAVHHFTSMNKAPTNFYLSTNEKNALKAMMTKRATAFKEMTPTFSLRNC